MFVWTDRPVAQVLAEGVPNNYPFLVAYFDPSQAPRGGTLLKVRVEALGGVVVNDRFHYGKPLDRMLLPRTWLGRGVARVTHAYRLDEFGDATAGWRVVGAGDGAVPLRMRVTGATHGVTGLPEQVDLLSTGTAPRDVYLLVADDPAEADPGDVTFSDEWVLLYRKKPEVPAGWRLLRVPVPGRALIDLTAVRQRYPTLDADVPALARARADLLLPLRAADQVQDLSRAVPANRVVGVGYDLMSTAYTIAPVTKVYSTGQNVEPDTRDQRNGQLLPVVLAQYQGGTGNHMRVRATPSGRTWSARRCDREVVGACRGWIVEWVAGLYTAAAAHRYAADGEGDRRGVDVGVVDVPVDPCG